MPELPEAETIVRGIRSAVSGRRIEDVEVLHRDVLVATPTRLRRGLAGRRIAGAGRRAKNVLLEMDDGSVVWINLGMTGGVLSLPRPPRTSPARARYGPVATHPAVVFLLGDGTDLVFDDSRRFGTIQHLDPPASEARSRAFGPEPLTDEFTPTGLWSGLRASRAPVRSWLLDQRKLAGVGNIYANEALFLAGIHPARRACTVRRHEAEALHRTLRSVLTDAVRAEGTTIRDYRNAQGGEGKYGLELKVYGQEGSPCIRCSSVVQRVVFGNRSAFLCPACQPRRAVARRTQSLGLT
jgi:formamidopyrimidine-DNA glycosylase